MNVFSFLFPIKIKSFFSTYNGKINIIEFFGNKSIEVDGLMQSGPLLKKIFLRSFKQFKLSKRQDIKKILLLGLGGGTLVRILREMYPESFIHVIEIDPIMKDIAKKYFGLDELKNVKVTIGDV